MNRSWLRLLPTALAARLEGRPALQGIIGNTGWLMADRMLRLGVGLLVGVWVARYLGPAQFGLLSYAQALVSLFAVLASLGLDGIVVRDMVRHPGCRDETLGSAFLLKLAGAVLTLALSAAAGWLLTPGDRVTFLLVTVVAAGTLFQAFDVVDLWFQSQVQARSTVLARSSAFLALALVKVALILAGAPLIAFAWAGVAELALGAAGLVLAYRRHGLRPGGWRASLNRARVLVRESWPLILSGLAILVYMKIDQIMLARMVGAEAVGLYAAAARISELWYFIPSAIVSSSFPALLESQAADPARYRERLGRLFRLLALIAYLIALPLSLLAGYLVPALFGAGYQGAVPILSIHIWASLFVFLGVGQGPWNIAEGYLKLSLQRTMVGALLNVALNLVLIPAYAGVGAAVATVLSYAASAFVMNCFDRRTRPLFYIQIKALLLVRS